MHQKRDLFSAESRAQGAFPAVKQAMCPAHAIRDGQNVATLETICMADGPDRNGFSMHPKSPRGFKKGEDPGASHRRHFRIVQ